MLSDAHCPCPALSPVGLWVYIYADSNSWSLSLCLSSSRGAQQARCFVFCHSFFYSMAATIVISYHPPNNTTVLFGNVVKQTFISKTTMLKD